MIVLKGRVIMIEIKLSKDLTEDAKHIRTEVFIKEQGFSAEFDDTDKAALHCVLYSDGKAAAVGRTYPADADGSTYVIGRIAVLPEFRKAGLGSKAVTALEQAAAGMGAVRTELSAQVRAADFYRTLGYEPTGEEYLDEFCPHIKMVRSLI